MISTELTGLLVVAAAGLSGGRIWLKRRAEQNQARSATAKPLQDFLAKEIYIYQRLDPTAQSAFAERAMRFLDDQRMFYVDPKVAKDPVPLQTHERELGWRIAAAAAQMTMGLPALTWPNARDILVYPEAFDEDYHASRGGNILGMVHAQGPVIFSARDLKRSFRAQDGHNVAIHELAHVLDMADGYADGSISGSPIVDGKRWSQMVHARILEIRASRYRALGRYAGTNEAEFFAVAVEHFFEEPHELHKLDPKLFTRLEKTFCFDPRPFAEH